MESSNYHDTSGKESDENSNNGTTTTTTTTQVEKIIINNNNNKNNETSLFQEKSDDELAILIRGWKRDLFLAEQEFQQRRRSNRNNNNNTIPFVGMEEEETKQQQLFKSVSTTGVAFEPPTKKGYLWKWQDRQIGWGGGTKWDKRYVCLKGGVLSYFKKHSDYSPRYELTLARCAVRDDGHKVNSRNKRINNNNNNNNQQQQQEESFHVFSIYQRSTGGNNKEEEEHNIVPLLRFSTTNLEEKKVWIQFLSEACAYCDSETFYNIHSQKDDLRRSSSNLRQYINQSKGGMRRKGTLPAMYFEPKPALRMPSHSNLRNLRRSYIRVSKDVTKVVKSKCVSYPPSKPMHREAAPSYLSHESQHPQNYRGILNLGILILIVSNFRLILQNIAEHGFILTRLTAYFLEGTTFNLQSSIVHAPPLLSGVFILNVAILLSLSMEYALSRRKLSPPPFMDETVGMWLHYTMAHVFAFILPNAVVWFLISNPFVGAFYQLFSTVTWMKLLSYIHANQDYRNSSEQLSNGLISDLDEESLEITYPENVSLKNIYYFMLAPTLTYQIAYPRMEHKTIRWGRVANLLFRLLFCMSISALLIGQVVSPQLTLLMQDLEKYQEQYVFSPNVFGKYLLRLTLANTYVWLLGFYCLFHLWLNILAELLRFGDCVFYRDWWNSSEVSAYWRLWNLPVHYWLVRHVYFPCIRFGLSKTAAMFMVFFFSAVMHEVLISVPFHMIRPWAFWGMMGQIPLVFLTKYVDKRHPGSSFGNISFWVSFCFVGQPMACLMYTIDYWKRQGGLEAGNPSAGIMSNEL